MQNVTWQDLIQLGIMLSSFLNILITIYYNERKK